MKLPKENYQKLLNDVYHHIGAPGIYMDGKPVSDVPPHPDVDEHTSGFMSSETYNDVQTIFKTRKRIAEKESEAVDILTLPPGFYTGVHFKNTFQKGVTNYTINVDVTEDVGRMKRIVCQTSSDSRIYIKNIHQGTETPWRRIYSETLLWNGNEKKIGSILNLEESVNKFEFFEITLNYGAVNQEVKKTYSVDTNLTHFNLADGVNADDKFQYYLYSTEFKLDKVNETQLKISKNKQLMMNLKLENNTGIEQEAVSILRVSGWK